MDEQLRAVGARLKKNTDMLKPSQNTPANMPADPMESLRIRGKMIGVLLRDARVAAGRTIEDLARLLHTSEEQVEQFEYGDDVPTLPQLEIMAYYLEVPVSHFWGQSTLEASREDYTRSQNEYLALRDRMIGALMRKAREERGFTLEELSIETGIDAGTIERYELGETSIPMHALSVLATAVRKNMNFFMETGSHLGELLNMRERWKLFSELPPDVRVFAANPLNVGFIEIAMMLAQMPVDKLRSVGESVLNITM